MSVHGEYARALALVLDALGQGAQQRRNWNEWIAALDAAQATQTRDLSTAALTARSILDRIEAALDSNGRPTDADARLRDVCHHLRAHCQAILGSRVDRR